MAEGGGLLNRYTPSRRIEGSNPSVSASYRFSVFFAFWGLDVEPDAVPLSAPVSTCFDCAVETGSEPVDGDQKILFEINCLYDIDYADRGRNPLRAICATGV